MSWLQLFDNDGDGLISYQELAEGMKEMGATEDQLRPIFVAYDTNGDGMISITEFAPLAEMVLGASFEQPCSAQVAFWDVDEDLVEFRQLDAKLSMWVNGTMAIPELHWIAWEASSRLLQCSPNRPQDKQGTWVELPAHVDITPLEELTNQAAAKCVGHHAITTRRVSWRAM